MLRQEEGRAFLGSAMGQTATHNADDRRRVPVSGSPAQMGQGGFTAVPALQRGGGAETISHIQNWCPALKDASIAAHHALAAMIFTALQAHRTGR